MTKVPVSLAFSSRGRVCGGNRDRGQVIVENIDRAIRLRGRPVTMYAASIVSVTITVSVPSALRSLIGVTTSGTVDAPAGIVICVPRLV
jgi:hypothetical protein